MKGDLRDLDVRNKKVIVRVDFNVPLSKEFKVTDDTRLRGAVPTIQYLIDQQAKVILVSHFGRPLAKLLPDGQIDKQKNTLQNVVSTLSELLGKKVEFYPDVIGDGVKQKVDSLEPGDVLLLENTRFYPGEEKGDARLAADMASLGEYYVNDAFGAAHRAHASTTMIADHFDSTHKAFGFLMQKELDHAKRVLADPQHPYVAIMGGAKVSDKILLIEALLEKADKIIIGGGMAYTFIKAQGGHIGNSLVEEDKLDLALTLLEKARKLGKSIVLPSDSIAADKFAPDALYKNVPSHEIPSGWMALDIGLTARFEYSEHLKGAQTIMWNGPMGVFEMEAFGHGTKAVALAVADATKEGAFSLIGGGDSAAAIEQSGLADEVSFISTGGGAMLELLEGKTLPGVAAILK
ncbi:MAG TPA: phosphoglycerate kinase [Saprospiraceae bacterium]